PPVLRSSLMFSLLQAGLTINRRATTYNILAASAVLLMLFNPLIIMDVGFQLSYLAVAGIVYLQPKIARLLLIKIPSHPKHKKEKNLFNKSYSLLRYDLVWLRQKLLDGCWQLTAVSIAAQIATLPLCLMYFGQFPNLFLLTNLVVLPLSNLVLFSGVAMFVCSYLPGLNIATGWLFNLLIGWLNHFIFAIDKLPFAVTRGIAFGAFEMLLLFLLIIFLSWYSEVGKPKVLLASLVILLSLSSFNAYKTFDSTRHTEIIVYDVPQHKAITFIQGNRAITDFDDSLRNDQTNFNNHIWPHWQNCGINKETTFSNSVLKTYPCCWGALFVFEGKRVLITNNTSRAKTPADDKKIPIDLLIVSGNPPISIGQLTTAFDIHQIVFDSSDKPWKVGKWMNECNSAHINAYNVKEQGAYVRLLSAR
ncbi:MAG TPA: ComEC/Rec2 family competence protein, partial [Chitinophagales bacterium]|nr:ComEC/Rec2 family competence protein [Chitinophagales bacterium]